MLSFEELANLRLRSFLPSGTEVTEHGGWEWMDGVWHYEGIGFTWFGRLEQEPDVTSGLELYFRELSPDVVGRILSRLGLSIKPGMQFRDVDALFGSPYQTLVFADDRKTYQYQLNAPETYIVSCTIQDEEGLIHVSLIRNDVRRRLAVA